MDKRPLTSLLVVILFVLIILLFIGVPRKGVDTGTYQAVFLTNGQVYFGKLSQADQPYLALTDIYYLRKNLPLQEGQEKKLQENQVALIKFGDELHGPEDRMFISRDQVIFWENLKPTSNVVVGIKDFGTRATPLAPAPTAEPAPVSEAQKVPQK